MIDFFSKIEYDQSKFHHLPRWTCKFLYNGKNYMIDVFPENSSIYLINGEYAMDHFFEYKSNNSSISNIIKLIELKAFR